MIINEAFTAKGFTPAAQVPAVFGRKRTIDEITIHHWGAPGQTHNGVVNFFVNGPGTTSAHFVASSDGVHCLVSPEDAAWHTGNAKGNATSVGIECRPEATEADYAVVAELVRWLRDTYGAGLPLVKHSMWNNTACPGKWDLDKIDRLARGTSKTVAKHNLTEDDFTRIFTSGDGDADKVIKEFKPILIEIRDNVRKLVYAAGAENQKIV